MPRADMADHLVHFMTGPRWGDAFVILQQILLERQLRGSGRINRGHYRCVCFSEAPLPMVPDGPVNEDGYSRYTPFGILFDKRWIFAQGGRPVIYQPEAEYDVLPETLRWRHMRYEIDGAEPVDLTWEREWRCQGGATFADKFLRRPIDSSELRGRRGGIAAGAN